MCDLEPYQTFRDYTVNRSTIPRLPELHGKIGHVLRSFRLVRLQVAFAWVSGRSLEEHLIDHVVCSVEESRACPGQSVVGE